MTEGKVSKFDVLARPSLLGAPIADESVVHFVKRIAIESCQSDQFALSEAERRAAMDLVDEASSRLSVWLPILLSAMVLRAFAHDYERLAGMLIRAPTVSVSLASLLFRYLTPLDRELIWIQYDEPEVPGRALTVVEEGDVADLDLFGRALWRVCVQSTRSR